MTTKKTSAAQLDREIAEVLSSKAPGEGDGSTDPAQWPQIFDRLRPGQTIYIAMTSVMGMGRAESGNYVPHKVGRRSKSKTPRWWTEAITLEPADGSKSSKFAQYKLWKGKNGGISMSHGDMAVMLKGIYASRAHATKREESIWEEVGLEGASTREKAAFWRQALLSDLGDLDAMGVSSALSPVLADVSKVVDPQVLRAFAQNKLDAIASSDYRHAVQEIREQLLNASIGQIVQYADEHYRSLS